MDCFWFDENVKPLLKGALLEYSSFSNGDFGDLERVEVEISNKLGTVEFWSKGWVGVDVYDCVLDEQVLNILLSPEEGESVPQALNRFVEILMRDS